MRASTRSRCAARFRVFSRGASGHCYFSLKDAQGQLRCAMFRRAASLLDFSPRDGDLVEVRGRLAVYEPRGDLQLVVESLRGPGRARCSSSSCGARPSSRPKGLFDPARKRALPPCRAASASSPRWAPRRCTTW
jgi:exodeoxyribonuclease VII large subunit